jgi:hypothetical protein
MFKLVEGLAAGFLLARLLPQLHLLLAHRPQLALLERPDPLGYRHARALGWLDDTGVLTTATGGSEVRVGDLGLGLEV